MRATIVNPNIDKEVEYYHLGVASIASLINHGRRHRAEVVDFTFHWDHWEKYLSDRLLLFRPQVVGISAHTPRVPSALKVARAVRRILPDARIVFGGHHPSLDTPGIVRRPEVDFVVIGEGEYTFLELLDTLEDDPSPEGLRKVRSLAWIEGGEIIENPLRLLPCGPLLDDMPPMDWTLWEQHARMIFHLGYLPMIGVRGCPGRCSFCSSSILARRMAGAGPFVRAKDPRRVVEEAAFQYERHAHQGLRYLFFYDQCFLSDPEWLGIFAEEYQSRGLSAKLPISVYSRVDQISRQTLDLARKAGVAQLRLGGEAADPHVRNDVLNKGLPQDVLEQSTALLREYDFKSVGYFMMGMPGETLRQSAESFLFARRSGMDRAVFMIFTPLIDQPLMEGLQGVDYLNSAESAGFYRITGAAETASGRRKALQKALFLGSNGYFLAKTLLRQMRGQGLPWLLGLPGYVREARADANSVQMALTQYVYYHGESLFF